MTQTLATVKFRDNLRRKVEDHHIQEYVDRLDKKYDFVYNEEWDEATENEVLEDDYITKEEHGY